MRGEMIPLAEVCEINPRLPKNHLLTDDVGVSFVPMAAVDEHEGVIAINHVRPFGEVKKGYTSFRENDVLFAKITPCMENGKAAVVRALQGGYGFGSTEFHVLRATERLMPEWIFYYVRREQFRAEAKRNFTGTAGQQRVPTSFLQSTMIPVPPLPEQRRIVDILSRAESIVRLRREAQKKVAELIPALFTDLFGDPANNPKGWPTALFSEVGSLDRGKSRHRPRDAQELYGGPYPFIQTGDVSNCGGTVTEYTATYSELGLKQSKLWPRGTLCITIAANIAKTGVLDFDACFPDNVVGFITGKSVRTEFVQAWLGFLQPTLEALAPQAAQKNINLEILRNLPIPVPPRQLQDLFSRRCESVRAVQTQQATATTQAEATFNALLAQVFTDA